MTNNYHNIHRKSQAPITDAGEFSFPSIDIGAVRKLLALCPEHKATLLFQHQELATLSDVQSVWIKDERNRMGLGSFKALGAAYVIAHDAALNVTNGDYSTALYGRTYVAASAGNHGLSVAAGARLFGANAVIYMAQTVPVRFADHLRGKGAEVRIEGNDYQASMDAAKKAATDEGAILLSDSSWEGYFTHPHRLMEGYLAMAEEIVEQCDSPPTHVFLQAGVGGMAAAVAAYLRQIWGDDITIIVVEPDAAATLLASARAGRSVTVSDLDSNMGRLDCKSPSLIALNGLMRDADWFVAISDTRASETALCLEKLNLSSTTSGIAGVAALLEPGIRNEVGINSSSSVLCIVSESAGS